MQPDIAAGLPVNLDLDAKIVLDLCSCAKIAEAASEEPDSSKYNSDDAEYETCSSDTCGLTCCLDLLSAVNAEYETNDSERKCDDRRPAAEESENDCYDAKYETGDSCALSVRSHIVVHDVSHFINFHRAING